jgi:hypothetical protein
MPLKSSVIKKIEDLFYKIDTNISYICNYISFISDKIYNIDEWFRFVLKSVGTNESIMDAFEMIDYARVLVIKSERKSADHFIVKCLNNIIFHLNRYIQLVRGN